MARVVYTLILGLFGALLVNIITVFLIPNFAENDAWSRLSKIGNPGSFAIIEQTSDIAVSMRSFDPNFVTAACRFSLADGPIGLAGTAAPDFWSLSVYNRHGANIFSVNDRGSQSGMLDLVVATPLQLIEFQKDMPTELSGSVFAEADVRDGFVILRAFAPEASMRGLAEDFVSTATCEPL